MEQTVLDIYRTTTAVLLVVGIFLCLRNRIRYRTFYTRQELVGMNAKLALAFGPVVGLIWNVAKHAHFNLGLPFVSLGAGLLIYASLSKPERLEQMEIANEEALAKLFRKRPDDGD